MNAAGDVKAVFILTVLVDVAYLNAVAVDAVDWNAIVLLHEVVVF